MGAIFLIIGGPAAGKSTTARAVAARFERSVHIPVDVVVDRILADAPVAAATAPAGT